jgi:hypothetical protein
MDTGISSQDAFEPLSFRLSLLRLSAFAQEDAGLTPKEPEQKLKLMAEQFAQVSLER